MLKKSFYSLNLILIVILLVACTNSAENNAVEELTTEIVQISVEHAGEGVIKVFIDDEEVMEVKNEQTVTKELSLLPGTHTIQTKDEGDKSNVLGFEVEAGKENTFRFLTEYGVKLTLLNDENEKTQSAIQEEVVIKKEDLNNNEKTISSAVEKQTAVSKRAEYIQKLNDIEEGLVDIKYLYEKGITSEMIEAESIRNKRWDDALNEIYGVLKKQLSTNEMELLRQEQRQWIKDRDNTAKKESLQFEGGTFEPLQYISTQARLTKERCYELVSIYMK